MRGKSASLDPEHKNLIVFDSECVLCTGFFRFMLRHDRAGRFAFVTAQSPLGQRLYRDQGLPADNFETSLVIIDGRTYQRLEAFAAAMRMLPWPWPVLSVCRFLPQRVKDVLYFSVTRNRYRLLGRRDACMIPSLEVRARFAREGYGG